MTTMLPLNTAAGIIPSICLNDRTDCSDMLRLTVY